MYVKYISVLTHVITMGITTKIQKIGNSYGIIIRKPILDMLDINKGDVMKLTVKGKKIELSKKIKVIEE